jgi:hypothetical protein
MPATLTVQTEQLHRTRSGEMVSQSIQLYQVKCQMVTTLPTRHMPAVHVMTVRFAN